MLYPIVRVTAINTIHTAHNFHSLISSFGFEFPLLECFFLLLDFIATTENNFPDFMASFKCSANTVTVEMSYIRMCCMQHECIFAALFRLKKEKKIFNFQVLLFHILMAMTTTMMMMMVKRKHICSKWQTCT